MSENKDQEKGKLVSMDAEKAKRTPKVKIEIELLHKALLDAMMFSPLSLLPKFPRHFITIKASDGTKIVAEIQPDDELRIVTEEVVSDAVVKYGHSLGASRNVKYLVSSQTAAQISATWKALSHPIEMPKLVRFRSEHGTCLRRVPFDAIGGGIRPHPTWNKLLGRMSNAKAFKAFIGAMFVEGSYEQSYLWIHGYGGEGKGAIGRFLGDLFGASYCAFQSAKHNDFWLYNLLDKRCVVFTDLGNQSFVTDGRFKSLTGGDAQFIDRKHKPAFFAKLPCRFVFLSNERPSLSTEHADMRRVIYCTLAPPAADEVTHAAFEAALWEEGAGFIGSCLETYAELCPTHGPIPTDMTEAVNIAEENESWMEEVVRRYFNIPNTLGGSEYTTKGCDMVSFERRIKINSNAKRRSFHDFIARRYAVKGDRDGEGRRYWAGIALKPQWRAEVDNDEFNM